MEHAINPFRARTSRQRDENFPPFEEAIARTGGTPRTQEDEARDSRSSSAALLNQSGCSSSDANLSISARAALNEHNRHVARYGLDDEDDEDETQQSARASAGQPRNDKAEGEDTSTLPAPAPENALDAEWDRLNSSHAMINVSHAPSSISTNDDSIHSSPDGRYCDRVVASHSLSGEEAIEVMTDLLSLSGVSDYFNTSRALEQLRTPESVRNAPESTRNQVTDRRSRYDHVVFPDSRGGPSSSVASTSLNESCLNEEEQHMRHLFRIAGLPPPPQDFLSETSGIDSRNGSFSLNQVDLSHISADSETGNVDLSFQNQSLLSGGDPLIAIDEIHPSDTSYTSEQQQLRVRNKVLPYMSASSSRSPRRRPTSNQNNSSSSSSSSHHHQRKLPPKSPLRMRHSPAASPSPWTTPPRPRTSTRDSSQSEFSPSAFAASSVPSTGAAAAAAAAEAALSPLSKLAADRASQIMRSDDWKTTKGTAAEPFPNLFSYNSLHNSTGSSRDEVTSVVVEYDGQYDISNDEAISPLHSSSSEQKKQRNSSSGTISSHTAKSDLKDKSSSLSSISPNSSSNLRRGPYQNLSSSSSSPNPRADPRASSSFPVNTEFAPPQDNNSVTKQRASPPPSPFGSSNHSRNDQSSVLSFGADDRRWYRTVVPSRVFVAEPCDFPDDNDSFSVPPPMPTAWSPRRVFPWRDEHGFPVDGEYYGDPLEYGGESSSAPAKQQNTGVPVVSPTEVLGGRSVKSSPR